MLDELGLQIILTSNVNNKHQVSIEYLNGKDYHRQFHRRCRRWSLAPSLMDRCMIQISPTLENLILTTYVKIRVITRVMR